MTQPIAVITGGSRGLGRSAVLHLVSENVAVIFTYQRQQKEAQLLVEEVQQLGGTAIALPLDVTDADSRSTFRERLVAVLDQEFGQQHFDYLVNNAGYGIFQPFAETSEDDLDAMFSVHLKGPFLLTRSLAPLIVDGGKVLNVSSGLTRMTLPGYDAYAAMKGAVEVATRYQAAALAKRMISVNVLAPGAIETDFGGGVVRDQPDLNRHIAAMTAMGRVGLPDDIGSAIAGILVASSQWMTGQRIEVSGGQGL